MSVDAHEGAVKLLREQYNPRGRRRPYIESLPAECRSPESWDPAVAAELLPQELAADVARRRVATRRTFKTAVEPPRLVSHSAPTPAKPISIMFERKPASS